MQFLTLLTTIFSAATAVTVLDKRNNIEQGPFTLISIHSGSSIHLQSIKEVDSHLHVFSVGGTEGNAVSLTLYKNQTLVGSTGRGVNIDGSTGEFGLVDPWGQESPSVGFSIVDGDLKYSDKAAFFACPSGSNKYSLVWNKSYDGCIGIGLRVV